MNPCIFISFGYSRLARSESPASLERAALVQWSAYFSLDGLAFRPATCNAAVQPRSEKTLDKSFPEAHSAAEQFRPD